MDDLIDAHAHVWDASCRPVPGARYHPGYIAPTYDFLRILDAHGIAQAVLVQPSFLGADNRYLLDALRAHPDRLRGIVVLEPGISADAMDDMTALGVIGLRYNLLSLPPAELATDRYANLTEQATARGWWIEVQAHGQDWPMFLPHLAKAPLMIDHFGKPSGPDCPGFQAVLRRDPANTCAKLSAPYRQAIPDMTPYAAQLIQRFGADRCLWGSDWPWTQHEQRHTYATCLKWLRDWTSPEKRAYALKEHAGLLGFPRLNQAYR